MIRMWRNHDGERPDDRPTPVVRLDPEDPILPRKPTNLRVPDLGPPITRDHETLALEALDDLTPLSAYWAAHRLFGPAYASTWSAWVAAERSRRRTLASIRWQHENGET